jgi:hypothetical protein
MHSVERNINREQRNETMTINQINQVSAERYGFQVNGLCPTSALWLAEHILETTGKNVYKTISSFRNKYGRGTSFPAFGTELFKEI